MADRKTSDDVAKIASRLMTTPSPFSDVKVRMAVQSAISNGVRCSSPSAVVKVVVPDAVVDEIEQVLEVYFREVKSVAASAVAQADGE